MADARKVCIAGFAPETRDMVNALPADYTVYSMNNFPMVNARPLARLYQIHPADWKSEQGAKAGTFGRGDGFREMLQAMTCPIYMNAVDADFPTSVAFPRDALRKHFGSEYFTSTPAWMMGHLIWEHQTQAMPIERVVIYGITLSTTHEYFLQRPCLEYWIGYARALGIAVEIPSQSTLLKGPTYGFESMDQIDQLRKLSQERVHMWRKQHYDARDTALAAQAVGAFARNLGGAIQQTTDGKQVYMPEVMKLIDQLAGAKFSEASSTFAAMREAQDSLLRLGSADMPPTDVAPIDSNIPQGVGAVPIKLYTMAEIEKMQTPVQKEPAVAGAH